MDSVFILGRKFLDPLSLFWRYDNVNASSAVPLVFRLRSGILRGRCIELVGSEIQCLIAWSSHIQESDTAHER